MDTFLKKELSQNLKLIPTFKFCIDPEHLLQFQNGYDILTQVSYEKLQVTVFVVEEDFYVLAYKNLISHKKWSDTTDNIFNIPKLISDVLESL